MRGALREFGWRDEHPYVLMFLLEALESAIATPAAGETIVQSIARSSLEREFRRISRPRKRATRKAVAKALNVSEATLERACKEGLGCHPWHGNLED